MGMVLEFVTLSDANIARVLGDPPLVYQVLYPEDPEIYESAHRDQARVGFLGRLLIFRRKPAPPPPVPPITFQDDENIHVDVDKAWHGIHYLLTGTDWGGGFPHNFIVGGGHQVGDLDVGYGAARALTSVQVRDVLAVLEPISEEDLRQRFDPADMKKKQIYPDIWDRGAESLDYLLDSFLELRAFLSKTVQKGLGVIMALG